MATAALLLTSIGAATGAAIDRGAVRCRLVLEPTNKFTRVVAPAPPPGGRHAAANTATITVNYTGFTPQAQAAFQFAVDIWQTQVASSIPIVVNAQFKDLGTGTLLGQAGPNTFLANFNASVRSNTWYPVPIVNKISLFDTNGTAPEIDAQFNSQRPDWYFGTDARPPANTIDFVSVVLHELGHGLGFIGAGDVTGGVGTVRASVSGPNRYPYIYDAWTIDSLGQSLTNTSVYPDNSAALAAALQSGDVFWNGPSGSSGPQPPRIYAPTTWLPGSSYSHLDEATYAAGNVNSLMTPSIGFSEAIHVPGPIALGIFQDMGWVSSSCAFLLSSSSATVPAGGGTGTVGVTADTGCVWTAASNASFVSITSASSGSGSGSVTYSIAANTAFNQRVATLTIAGQTFTITQAGTGPTVSLDRSTLQFAATNSGASFVQQTTSQTVRISQNGTGTVGWTAISSQPWITVSPASGSGPATLTIGVVFSTGLPVSGTSNGTITLSFTGAGKTAGPINVGLTTIANGASAAPFGVIDTPADNATGVTGSIPVSGWALDDIEVRQVQILRDPVSGEGPAQIFIGTAVVVDGARPDVVALNPSRPRNTQAGWGYLMLTNFLPNQGNGTFRISAVAIDAENRSTVLGSRTITCTNNTATLPFGAIDTPGQGEVISGSNYTNFGWVLARGPARADPPSGGTVRVLVDGVFGASPGGWASRSDLTAFFPAGTYPGVTNALGVSAIDSTALANGAHTIAWVVTSNTGQTDGIGSRFFTVANSTSAFAEASADKGSVRLQPDRSSVRLQPDQSLRLDSSTRTSAPLLREKVNAAPLDRSVITGRRGYDPDTPLRSLAVVSGQATLVGEELDRFEVHLGGSVTRPTPVVGYVRVAGDLAPLPIGSHLDPATGVFTWQPGVGFVHDYDLVFVRCEGRAATCVRREVRFTLHPKQSNRIGPQVTIDEPTANAEVVQPFLVGGWAIDLDDHAGTGVETLHVWAYPVSPSATHPIFLGATTYGGARPDVGAIFGERFTKSGYGITVESLPPGTYDLAVFAWSTITGGFVPAKVVRVTVR